MQTETQIKPNLTTSSSVHDLGKELKYGMSGLMSYVDFVLSKSKHVQERVQIQQNIPVRTSSENVNSKFSTINYLKERKTSAPKFDPPFYRSQQAKQENYYFTSIPAKNDGKKKQDLYTSVEQITQIEGNGLQQVKEDMNKDYSRYTIQKRDYLSIARFKSIESIMAPSKTQMETSEDIQQTLKINVSQIKPSQNLVEKKEENFSYSQLNKLIRSNNNNIDNNKYETDRLTNDKFQNIFPKQHQKHSEDNNNKEPKQLIQKNQQQNYQYKEQNSEFLQSLNLENKKSTSISMHRNSLEHPLIPLIPNISQQKREINIFKQNLSNPKPRNKEERYQGYVIEQQLGTGKYSVVYLARHIETNFRVALKVIQKKQMIEQKMEMQLAWEIKIQYLLKHPNIVQLYTFFKTDTEIVLVLEYCPGGHLLSYMRKFYNQQLDEKEAQKYIRQVTLALAFLHSSEVLHRDLKPENILLSYGTAKLADFSFCIYSPHEYRRTQCGTLVYSSPEVMSGDLYDNKSDLWGLGVLAYELCFGETPWCDLNGDQQLESIKHAQIDIPPAASQNLRDFIERLVKRIPRERMTCRQALSHPWLKEEIQKEPLFITLNKQLFR